MNSFGRILGATFVIVLVGKVGLTVVFHAQKSNTEQAHKVENKINNTTAMAASLSPLAA